MIDRRSFIAMSTLGLAAVLPARTWATTPLKLARLIVGFPPGGAADAVARLLAEHLKGYAETIVVENRPGAGGRIALGMLKSSPADGATILLTPGDQLSLFPHIYKSLPYDPLKDFTTASTVSTVQFLLVVGPMVPASVDTLQSFLAWCRANPKLASYGTAGAGTRQHMLGDALSRAAGVDLAHVPYKGAAPALQDLLAGQVAAGIAVISATVPQIRSGKLRGLMSSAPNRSAMLPDVPTAREVGFPDLEAVETFGLLLPTGTPPIIVDALNAATRHTLAGTALREGLAKLALEPAGSTPADYTALIRSDLDRWARIVRNSGFKPTE